MQYQPLTLEEAVDIAEDFEDLLDTDLIVKDGITYTVTHVVISPFNKEDQILFAENCVNQAALHPGELIREYNTTEYDVIIIAQDLTAETNKIYHLTDIRTFITMNGINYRMPSNI